MTTNISKGVLEKDAYASFNLDAPESISTFRSAAFALQNANTKASMKGLKPVGFNSYELIYRHLTTGNYTYSNVINYIKSCNANFVRVLYPVFSASDWLNHVFQGSLPEGEFTDESFRSTFLSRSDLVIDAMEVAGIKGLFCLFWSAQNTASLCNETLLEAIQVGSKTHDFMMRFARWFFSRYGKREVLAAYSFFNELTYDPMKAGEPTVANISSVTKDLLSVARQFAGDAIATTDINPFSLNTLPTRPTFAGELENLRAISSGFDALGIHIYGYGPTTDIAGNPVGNGMNFVGVEGKVTEAFTPAPTNTLGYEGMDSLLSAWRSVADSMGIPLWLTECGVPVAIESESSSLRRTRMLRHAVKHCNQVLVWNAADVTTPQSNQVSWQIKPGTELASTHQKILSQLNSARTVLAVPRCGALPSARISIQPEMCFRSTRSSGATVRVTSNASMSTTTQAVMFWFRRDSACNNFETYMYCRDASNAFGFTALAGAVASTDSDYMDFRSSSGSARNTASIVQRISDNEWHHFAYVLRTINGQSAIEIWIDGLFWDVVATSNTYAPIVSGTTLYFGGGSVNGCPVSMQDITLAAYASPDDILNHMHGAVLPQSSLHIRANYGNIQDISRYSSSVVVGSGVLIEPA